MNGHADPNARTPATKPGPAAAGPDAAAIGAPASLLAAIDESADALAARIATAAMSGASFHAPQDVFETQTDTNRIWREFLRLPPEARPKKHRGPGCTPHEVVCQRDGLKLLRYRGAEPRRFAEPVLICYALVNRPYVLDLQADRSVVRRLVDHGFDVYLIDWGEPTESDSGLGLADYIEGRLHDMLQVAAERSGDNRPHLLGYCMGGTMSAIYASLHSAQLSTLTLLATPIDFGGQASLLNVWTRPEYFDVDALIDAFGNCPGWLLRWCFQLMKPVQNCVEKYLSLNERLDDEAFLENFFALERWTNDSIPVAGETFRQFVKRLYQGNELMAGTMTLGDQPVRLENITCPLLLLVAEQDHLTPPSCSLPILDRVASTDTEALSIDAGHIGLAVSHKAHAELWPRAGQWLAARSTDL